MFPAQARTVMPAKRSSFIQLPVLLAISAGLVACAGEPARLAEAQAPASAPLAHERQSASAPRGSATAGASSAAAGQHLPAAVGQLRQAVALNPRHPDSYVVQRGDTLWDIAGRFLREPWVWPEIWQVNPQIANPHLIYPGDVISLVYIDGQPRLILERGTAERLSPRIREERIEDAIATIPHDAIRAFLSRPSVLTREQAETLPYVLSFRDGKLMAAAGEDIYVRGTTAESGSYFSVVNVGEALVDPDDGEVVGFQGNYTGRGRLRRGGDPATLFLTDSQRETLRGDRLLEEELLPSLNFMPRSPDRSIEGRIIAVEEGLSLIGPWMVVIINRGDRDGLAPGHVLQVYQAGEEIRDTIGGSGMFGEKVRLPEELAATMMIFRTFDRISYGLVMQSVNEFRVLDTVRNPGT